MDNLTIPAFRIPICFRYDVFLRSLFCYHCLGSMYHCAQFLTQCLVSMTPTVRAVRRGQPFCPI